MSGNLRLSGVKFQKSRKVGLVGQIIRQNEAEEKIDRLKIILIIIVKIKSFTNPLCEMISGFNKIYNLNKIF